MSQSTCDYNHSTQGSHMQPLNSTRMGNTPNIEYAKLSLTLPRSLIRSTTNVKTGSKLLKYRRWETLGEDVGVLRCRGDMKNSNFSKGDAVTNKV